MRTRALRPLVVLALACLASAEPARSQTIYFAVDGEMIRRTNLDGTNVEDVLSTGASFGMAIDLAADKLYWTNTAFETVERVNLDGSDHQFLIQSSPDANPLGIALDVANGKMYWADDLETFSGVSRANLDGKPVETVVDGLRQPNKLAFDPVEGKIYFTEVGGTSPKLPGIRRFPPLETVVAPDLNSDFDFGGALALDVANRKLYWADNSPGRIRRSNLDGTSQETLLTAGADFGNTVDLALDVECNQIYWIERATRRIRRAPINVPIDPSAIVDVHTVVGGLEQVTALALDPRKTCVLDVGLSHTPNGALTMTFNVGASKAATWTTWLWVGLTGTFVPLWSVPLPALESPVTFPLTILNFPSIGFVGVISVLSCPDCGVLCSDFEFVDTGL